MYCRCRGDVESQIRFMLVADDCIMKGCKMRRDFARRRHAGLIKWSSFTGRAPRASIEKQYCVNSKET